MNKIQLMDQFEIDIRSQVMARLPHDPSYKTDLEAMSLMDLFINYINWRLRHVPREIRTVHLSNELKANPLATNPPHQGVLTQIISDISTGADLTKYLSRGIKVGYTKRVPNAYIRQRDLDMMLNDWSVHHLHLSTNLEQDGFVTRTGDVLFVAFRPADAYLINIFPHTAWATNDVADILIDNWPKGGFVHEIPNAIGLSFQPTEANRKATRNAGIAMPLYARNGKVYMLSRGSLTTAGTSTAATRFADYLYVKAREFAEKVTAEPDWFKNELLKVGGTPAATNHFRFIFCDDDHFAVLEENSGVKYFLQ